MFRAALISMLLTSAALADTWTVDDDGKADFDNIQAAIEVASDGDEIIVMPGTYTTDQHPYVIDTWGLAITVRSKDGASSTILDGQNKGCVVGFMDGETSATILEGFTITGGSMSGITISDSSPTIKDCVISGNSHGKEGGGVSMFGSSNPLLTNCVISGNHSNNQGGGVGTKDADCNPTLVNCTIINNSAGEAGGGFATMFDSRPTLTTCIISENEAPTGGGVFCMDGAPIFTNCTISNNEASSNGGGIAAVFPNSLPVLTNCIISNNTAANSGGGIWSTESGTPQLENTVVCENTPDQINGNWNNIGGACLAFSCEDTDDDGIPDKCQGSTGDGVHEVPSEYSTIQEAIMAAGNGDTVLVSPGVWTGNGDWVINPQSKSITIQSTDGPGFTILDAENKSRVVYCGAGEDASTVIQGFTITNGYISEECTGGGIICTNNSSPKFIDCIITDNFAKCYGGGIYCGNFGGEMDDKSSPTFNGCTIKNNTSSQGGGIYCSWNTNPTLLDCIINDNDAGYGAGIYCEEGSSPTLTDCEINDNTAESTGGGMECWSSTPLLINCTFSSNSSNSLGGGIYLNGSSPQVTNCIITQNTSSMGGGIECRWESNPTLTDCTISFNSSDAGALSFLYSSPTLNNCTIANNASFDAGGGIYMWDNCNPTLNDCIITGNTVVQAAGGLYIGMECHPTLDNCTIQNNIAGEYGAGISVTGSVDLIDCSFSGNSIWDPDKTSEVDIAGWHGAFVSLEGDSSLSKGMHLWGTNTICKFMADSTCEVGSDVVAPPEGTTIFDIDNIETTASLDCGNTLTRQGGLSISNESGSLSEASIGNIIPFAKAENLEGDFDSTVLPPMPAGLGLQIIEHLSFQGSNDTEMALEVIGIDGADFANPFSGTVDSPPIDLIEFDADGDGRDEIAVLFDGTPGSVATFTVSDDGAPTPINGLIATVGNNPRTIDAGDIDGDGLEDLLVANSSDNSVSLILTQDDAEDGIFFTSSILVVPGTGQGVTSAAIIDWNGDSILDAVAGVDRADPEMPDAYQVLLNLSNSPTSGPSFDTPLYWTGGASYPDPPACADGIDATASGFVGGTRYGQIYHASSMSSLQLIADLGGNNTVTIEALDLDDDGGDGILDLMVASDETETIYLLQGDVSESDGFGDLIPIHTGEEISDVVALDADFDNDMDIVITAPNSDNPLILLRNDGVANFLPSDLEGRTWSKQIINVITPVTRLASGSLSPKDEEDDWVVGGGSSTAFQGDPVGVIEQTNFVTSQTCSSDFTGDGDVGVEDLLMMIEVWGACDACPQDLDDDGIVRVTDLLILIGDWGSCE